MNSYRLTRSIVCLFRGHRWSREKELSTRGFEALRVVADLNSGRTHDLPNTLRFKQCDYCGEVRRV